MDRPNKELLNLIFAALDHAVECVVDTDGPLIPFAMIESTNGVVLTRFTTGRNPDAARQDARSHVTQQADYVRYAVAADGTIVGKSGDTH